MTKPGTYVARNPRRKKASTLTALERLELNIGSRDGCWEWTGSRNPVTGYGVVQHDGRKWLAHRFAYELLVGPIPEGLTLDHLCSVKSCVCPTHLEPVSRGENARRGEKNRRVRSGGGWMAQRTHCTNGHEYVAGSYRMSGKTRVCKLCAADRMARFKARRVVA